MGVDVLDLVDLQRRGLLKRATSPVESPDVLDLTTSTQQPAAPIPSVSTSSDTSSAFDFLSSFAQAGTSTTALPSHSSGAASSDLGVKLDTIVNKLDDTMYKIELMSSRLAQLEARFGSERS